MHKKNLRHLFSYEKFRAKFAYLWRIYLVCPEFKFMPTKKWCNNYSRNLSRGKNLWEFTFIDKIQGKTWIFIEKIREIYFHFPVIFKYFSYEKFRAQFGHLCMTIFAQNLCPVQKIAIDKCSRNICHAKNLFLYEKFLAIFTNRYFHAMLIVQFY